MGRPDVRLHEEQRTGSNSERTSGVQRGLETCQVCPPRSRVRQPDQAADAKVTGAL